MTKNSSTTVALTINGRTYTRLIDPSMTLLDFIREEVSLTGTKRGCDVGECGCCTVLLEGKNVLSCVMLAIEAEGRDITTIEGLAEGPVLHPVQQAFVDHGALQCGFCTPAMVLNAVSMLSTNANPSRTDIKDCVGGTICRCTGYTKIEQAVSAAAGMIRDGQ